MCLTWWFWTRCSVFPTHFTGSRLWGTLSPPQKYSRASTSWAVYRHWESPWGKSASRGNEKPHAPNTKPSKTFNAVNVPGNHKRYLGETFISWWLVLCCYVATHHFLNTCYLNVSNLDFRTYIVHNGLTFIRLLKFAIQKSHVQSSSLTFVLLRNQIMGPCKSLVSLSLQIVSNFVLHPRHYANWPTMFGHACVIVYSGGHVAATPVPVQVHANTRTTEPTLRGQGFFGSVFPIVQYPEILNVTPRR